MKGYFDKRLRGGDEGVAHGSSIGGALCGSFANT